MQSVRNTSATPNVAEGMETRVLSALNKGNLYRPLHTLGVRDQVQKDFKDITATQLKTVLNAYFVGVCQKSFSGDPTQVFKELSEVIPLNKLEEAIKEEYPDHEDAIKEAKKRLLGAKNYFEKNQVKASSAITKQIKAIIDKLIIVLESFLIAFGITDLFKPAESQRQAEIKAYKITSLLQLLMLLSTTVIPLLGFAAAGVVMGAVFFTMGVFSLAYPHIRPMPSHLPKAQNFSRQAQQGVLSAATIKEEDLQEIYHVLLDNKKIKKHLMLIGPSRVGKTQRIKAFIADYERHPEKYPGLEEKRFFYLKAADLASAAGGLRFDDNNEILRKISEEMGRHRENIVLIIDEIHLLCQEKNANVGEQLKIFLDDNEDNFPNVIGISTEEEYYRDIVLKNTAFANRFGTPITVKKAEKKETIDILCNVFMEIAPKALLENGTKTIKYLYEQAEGKLGTNIPQPATAIHILSQCVNRTNEIQKTKSEVRVCEIRSKLDHYRSKMSLNQGKSLISSNKKRFETVTLLEDELKRLEEILKTEKKEFSLLLQKKDNLLQTNLAICRTTLKVAEFEKSRLSSRDKTQMSSFLLLCYFLAPALEKQINSEANQLGVKVTIDESLIDEVIKQEEANRNKVSEAAERGKKEMKKKSDVSQPLNTLES